jgi:hypothetical protein
METVLLIIAIAIAAMIFFRPAPQTQVIYVPVEVAQQRGGLGCLSLIILMILALLAVLALRGF